jgi:hypothetical protein
LASCCGEYKELDMDALAGKARPKVGILFQGIALRDSCRIYGIVFGVGANPLYHHVFVDEAYPNDYPQVVTPHVEHHPVIPYPVGTGIILPDLGEVGPLGFCGFFIPRYQHPPGTRMAFAEIIYFLFADYVHALLRSYGKDTSWLPI